MLESFLENRKLVSVPVFESQTYTRDNFAMQVAKRILRDMGGFFKGWMLSGMAIGSVLICLRGRIKMKQL